MAGNPCSNAVAHAESRVDGFVVHTFASDRLSCAVVPELGARIVSLRDLTSGREWLDGWTPPDRRLWHPHDPSDYATGPGAGIDECLPTVLPCSVEGRALSDHGELWNKAPRIVVSPDRGELSAEWTVESLPLTVMRTLIVMRDRVRFNYRLLNRADEPTPFQWAWHPLFTIEPGDELRFEGDPSTCVDPSGATLAWPHALPGCDLAHAATHASPSKCAKVFVGPLHEARAAIRARAGRGLGIAWSAACAPYAGVWITRGGWKGLHHWAVEPTNAPVDRLADAMQDGRLGQLVRLGPREVRSWHVDLTLLEQQPRAPGERMAAPVRFSGISRRTPVMHIYALSSCAAASARALLQSSPPPRTPLTP